MFEQTFKNIDDILHKDAGCGIELQSSCNLREVINRIDELCFGTLAENYEMSHLHEDKIRNMGSARRNGGEYDGISWQPNQPKGLPSFADVDF